MEEEFNNILKSISHCVEEWNHPSGRTSERKCSKSLTLTQNAITVRACPSHAMIQKTPNRRIKNPAQHESSIQQISEDGRALSCKVQSSLLKRGGTGASRWGHGCFQGWGHAKQLQAADLVRLAHAAAAVLTQSRCNVVRTSVWRAAADFATH